LFPLSPKPYFPFYLVRSSISENEERRVKARHDVTQFYQRRKLVSRRELPQADMTIEDNSSLAREEDSLEDDDVEDDTYMPSLRAPICGRGKGLASRSGSGSGAAEEEAFDVEEITPTYYVHMGNLVFRQPLNSDWREKVSNKGKLDLVREKRKENSRTFMIL
jgi:hypothetical protein